jgi:hypothetical protein
MQNELNAQFLSYERLWHLPSEEEKALTPESGYSVPESRSELETSKYKTQHNILQNHITSMMPFRSVLVKQSVTVQETAEEVIQDEHYERSVTSALML